VIIYASETEEEVMKNAEQHAVQEGKTQVTPNVSTGIEGQVALVDTQAPVQTEFLIIAIKRLGTCQVVWN
jgi:hypothetical protein